jgi:hypothetical protein
MIIIEKKGYNIITFHKEYKPTTENYSILFQNTITKEITTYNSTDIGNDFYLKFRIDIQLEKGEYYVLLFENPDKLNFYSDANNPKEIDYIRFIADDDKLLMSGKFYLVFGGAEQMGKEVKYIKSDLMRVGKYERNNPQYQKEQKYYQYNG